MSFFPSIELTLDHILSGDWYYLDALDNGGRRWRELYALRDVPCESFYRLRREQDAAGRLDETVVLNRPDERHYGERTQDVLAHLFHHDTHHRGHVHAMLAGTAVAPPQLDEFLLAQNADLRAGDLRTMGVATR